MARLRYVGDAEAKDVALSGGCIRFEKGQWVDLVAAAAEAGIRAEHAEIAARDLATLPDWETEKKSRKTADAEEN